MPKISPALKRRIVPTVLLELDLAEDGGGTIPLKLRLSFDFNAFALIQERCGLDMTEQNVWAALNPSNASVMLWAAVLACHPEYAGDEGLGVIRSYMDAGNYLLIAERLFDAYVASLPETQRNALMTAKEKALRGEPNPTPPPPALPEMAEEVARSL